MAVNETQKHSQTRPKEFRTLPYWSKKVVVLFDYFTTFAGIKYCHPDNLWHIDYHQSSWHNDILYHNSHLYQYTDTLQSKIWHSLLSSSQWLNPCLVPSYHETQSRIIVTWILKSKWNKLSTIGCIHVTENKLIMIKVMVCCLVGAKESSDPMLIYCQLDTKEQTSVKLE